MPRPSTNSRESAKLILDLRPEQKVACIGWVFPAGLVHVPANCRSRSYLACGRSDITVRVLRQRVDRALDGLPNEDVTFGKTVVCPRCVPEQPAHVGEVGCPIED